MLAKSDLPKVLYVRSTKSLSKEDAFDMFARFLNDERRRQNNTDHPSDMDTTNTVGGGGGGGGGEDYTSSSSSFLTTSMAQIWSELRMACNSLLDDIATEPTIMSSSSSNSSAPTRLYYNHTTNKKDNNQLLLSLGGRCVSRILLLFHRHGNRRRWRCIDVHGISHGSQSLVCVILPGGHWFSFFCDDGGG